MTEQRTIETVLHRIKRSWPMIRTMLKPVRIGYTVGFWWDFTRFWFPRVAVYIATGRLYR